MAEFTKRRYERVGQFWSDLRALWSVRREIAGIQRGKTISPAFRERLMLAVTAVNRCRYCTFVHTRAALGAGVTRGEIDGLFTGAIDSAPEDEVVALLYAQHWAQTKGHPDPETVGRLNAAYGAETASRINATITFINVNNLFGNTFDWVLNRLSFGLIGGA